MDHFDHTTMVMNILHYRGEATGEQVVSGRQWYPLAGRIVQTIADTTGSDPVRVCYALSALSPRNPWRWNVFDAYSFAEAKAQGRTMPRATTFKHNQAAAWRALDRDGQPWLTAAPKVTNFVAAIMGAPEAVVVDTWAVRVATGGAKSDVTAKQYAKVAAAYTEAAAVLFEEPRETQAITWLVAQTEGLATHRTSRHDLSFKAGTPDFIIDLLKGE